jgi:uncharacterized protein
VKFLLWLAIAYLVIWVLRAPQRRPSNTPPEAKKTTAAGETMRRCLHCGLHIPASEAVLDGEAAFCSEEHFRLHHSSR